MTLEETLNAQCVETLLARLRAGKVDDMIVLNFHDADADRHVVLHVVGSFESRTLAQRVAERWGSFMRAFRGPPNMPSTAH